MELECKGSNSGCLQIYFALIIFAVAQAVNASPASDDPDIVPSSPAAPLMAPANILEPCSFDTLPSPLTLFDSVSRALCQNPKTRGAWAAVRLNAASVRIARENYLPTLSATGKELVSSTKTTLNNLPYLDSSTRSTYAASSIALSWVLFDFGQRGDQLEAARQLFAAARANLDLNLQQVFLKTAVDFFEAQAEQASLEATQQIESLTKRIVEVSIERVRKGVAPISDQLQAETALAQAVVNRVKAEAELRVGRGVLAIDMGFDPDLVMTVPQAASDVDIGPSFAASIHDLIEEAKRLHPSVAVASKQLAAARADERAAWSKGLPTISLVGGISRSNEPLTPSLGSPSVPGKVLNKLIGIQIDVPISDSIWKRGAIAQAHAQVQIQEEAVYGAEQQVAQDVWNSYVSLQADSENVRNSEALVASAASSLKASQRRYEGGAGAILELLNAQAVYANSQQQLIHALSDWRSARYGLAASVAKLGPETFDGPR